MRCIEICVCWWLNQGACWLTLTWDVLKSHVYEGARHPYLRLTLTWDVLKFPP